MMIIYLIASLLSSAVTFWFRSAAFRFAHQMERAVLLQQALHPLCLRVFLPVACRWGADDALQAVLLLVVTLFTRCTWSVCIPTYPDALRFFLQHEVDVEVRVRLLHRRSVMALLRVRAAVLPFAQHE